MFALNSDFKDKMFTKKEFRHEIRKADRWNKKSYDSIVAQSLTLFLDMTFWSFAEEPFVMPFKSASIFSFILLFCNLFGF
jgi:hypothetical protein